MIILNSHDDVMTWNIFSHHWPFLRVITQSQADSPKKGDKLLYKQWSNRRFDMPWCSCGVTMYNGFDAASYVYVADDVINYF